MDSVRSSTLGELLQRSVSSSPDAVALRFKARGLWHDVTWQECQTRVVELAVGLDHLGVRAGDSILVMGNASAEWVYSCLALSAIGARALCVYRRLGVADVRNVLQSVRVDTAIVDDTGWLEALESEDTAAPQRTIVLGAKSAGRASVGALSLSEVTAIGRDIRQKRDVSWETLSAGRSADEVSIIFCSAGSTGQPKLVAHSSRTLIVSTLLLLERAKVRRPLGQRDVVVVELPTGHVGATIAAILLPMLTGLVAHMPETTVSGALEEVHPTLSINTAHAWEDMATRVHLAGLTARGLRSLALRWTARVRRPAAAEMRGGERARGLGRVASAVAYGLVCRPLLRLLGLDRLRLALVVGRISPELIGFWRQWGIDLLPIFGSAETGLCIAGLEDGSPRPAGEVLIRRDAAGGMSVRTDSLCCGYVRGSDLIPAGEDGWHHTGDSLAQDADRLIFLGPPGDLVDASSGATASLSEFEAHLRSSPYVRAAAAFAGDNRTIGVLLELDFNAIASWASVSGVKYQSPAALVDSGAVSALIEEQLVSANQWLVDRGLPKVSRVAYGSQRLVPGEALTPTWGLRRARVAMPLKWEISGTRTAPTQVTVGAGIARETQG